jgi:hypothetical protein
MEQLALIARLKPGAEPRAAELVADGPPFEVGDTGLSRHTVFLSADEVLFVFEGPEVEWIVDRLIDEPFHWELLAAMDEWRPLLDENPRIARCVYAWTRDHGGGATPKSALFHG